MKKLNFYINTLIGWATFIKEKNVSSIQTFETKGNVVVRLLEGKVNLLTYNILFESFEAQFIKEKVIIGLW